ncbi:MAG TPA: hypothetical protein VKT72_02205 [Candidatus Baltobacteraceae bacterium]|nr:hypothetical protein [Candidatus Baltobacteraceae bacterium]
MLTFVLAALTVLNNGACLDSIKSVPQGLFGAEQSSAVVKIDKVVSTATMTDGEILGYLYTRQDGTTWLGQRRQPYMSGADSAQINQVLGSTHMPNSTTVSFPPVRKYGVKTNYAEIFQVQIPATAMDPLHIRLDPCVEWPEGTPLPSTITQ